MGASDDCVCCIPAMNPVRPLIGENPQNSGNATYALGYGLQVD